MGGIASVACLPLARGNGYVEALLTRGLEQMRERGQVFSVLHAFLLGLYQPMGWEWAGGRRTYTFPLQILPRSTAQGTVREAGPADAETLRRLYEAYAARYQGTLIRPLSWWADLLAQNTGHRHYFFLYEDPDPQGYLCLHLEHPARVEELIWQSPAAYAGLLGALRRHRSQFESFVWAAPPDDPLWHYAANWEIATTWKPPFSARVVDLPAALAYKTPDPALAGQFTVQVEDPLASWNTGCWKITVEGGTVQAKSTTEAPQLACDIGAWSQVSFGDPDAGPLRRAGRLKVHDEAAFTLLQALFPPALAWTNDGF
jgi:predicted acetyltransferase